jgi:hypothetical protein
VGASALTPLSPWQHSPHHPRLVSWLDPVVCKERNGGCLPSSAAFLPFLGAVFVFFAGLSIFSELPWALRLGIKQLRSSVP